METRKFSIDGHIVEFYKENGDEKFRFRIVNEENLTEKLLGSCKTKRIKEKDIKYAIKGIREKLWDIKAVGLQNKPTAQNPIVELSEKIQKIFGENITSEVIEKSGPDHCPIVRVRITLPNGISATDCGSNQRIARQKAAKQLLETI